MASTERTTVITGDSTYWAGLLAGTWAIAGFVVVIGRAVLGMSPGIHSTLSTPLSGIQLAGYAAATLLFGVLKAYYIFHRSFCPRYLTRMRDLLRNPSVGVYALIAPLYCLNLVGARRARLIRGYLLVAAIAGMVMSTRLVPPPWRGMILTGVAVALTWAALEIFVLGIRELVLAYRASTSNVAPSP